MELHLEIKLHKTIPIKGNPGKFCVKILENLFKPVPIPDFIERSNKYCKQLGIEDPRSWKLHGYTGNDNNILNFLKAMQDFGLKRRAWSLAQHQIGLKTKTTGPWFLGQIQRCDSSDTINATVIKGLKSQEKTLITFGEIKESDYNLYMKILEGSIPVKDLPVYLQINPNIDLLISDLIQDNPCT